jgi:hypothetical protein
MLRGILSVLQLLATRQTAEVKHDLAWVAAAGLAGFLGAGVALLFGATAVFLALQPVIAAAWAALAAAGTALVLGALPFLVFVWRRGRARRRAAEAPVRDTKAENAIRIGTLASAFLSGVATGAGQRAAARNS